MTIHKFLVKGTVEERINALQQVSEGEYEFQVKETLEKRIQQVNKKFLLVNRFVKKRINFCSSR